MFLMWIKGFLGFTDGIKEPQKTKIENELKKFCRYNGTVYNAVTFLSMKLLEGCRPEKEESEPHCKRNGKLSKPKTLYRYTGSDQETYFKLNKTQYNFVCYLIENGLDTEKAMLAYDNAEEARRQTELEEKARQEAEERKQAEERERIHRMIEEQAQCIPPEEKEIVDRISVDLYGEEQPWNYSLVALILNLDDPYCKEEIILRLHNQNKASTKIFECITGLKLPTSYHERKHYIEGLTVADFKGMIQYKPQKKRKEKEVQKEEFYASERTPEGQKWTKVIGEPFTKYGVDMFISYGDGKVSIFCAEAGMKVCDGKTKTECMEKLKKVVDDRGKELFLRTIKDVTKHIYETIGTNPQYRRKMKMYSYQGIMFDDANTEEEAKALLPEVLEALAEGGFHPDGKEFVYVPGENDDVWEQEEEGPKFHVEFQEMKKYIRENRIKDYGSFARYCGEHRAEWAKLLEKQVNADTVRGYIRFLQKPRNQEALYGGQLR